MVVKFLTKLSLDALRKNLRFTKYLDYQCSLLCNVKLWGKLIALLLSIRSSQKVCTRNCKINACLFIAIWRCAYSLDSLIEPVL